MRIVAKLLSMCLLSSACLSHRAGAQPPATPVRPVTDVYHGVKVVDPYRWLESDDDPEVKAWSDAENTYARGILDRLPNLAAIRKRVTEVMSAESPSYSDVTFRGGRYFVKKNQPPKQQPLLVVLASPDDLAGERVVVDPNAIDPTGATSMDWYVASPDGKLVAVSLSVGGTERGDAHIYSNHVEGLTEQLAREPLALPRVRVAPRPIDELGFEDIALVDYRHHPFIKFPIAV